MVWVKMSSKGWLVWATLAVAGAGCRSDAPLTKDGATVDASDLDGGAAGDSSGADDDPVECPPCLDVGVCGEGAEAECVDGHWVCSYLAAAHESEEETLYDGLDNDCDGLVDEPEDCERCDGIDNDDNGKIDDDPVGAPGCWSAGVCAEGGTERCAGKEGAMDVLRCTK